MSSKLFGTVRIGRFLLNFVLFHGIYLLFFSFYYIILAFVRFLQDSSCVLEKVYF